MIVLGFVKELHVGPVHLCVVLAGSDMKIRDPCEFAIYVPLLAAERRPGGHPGTANGVLLVGVERLLGLVRNQLLLSGRLVEVLL